MKKTINVALIGTGLVARAHSNALIKVSHFFDLPLEPVRKVVCSIDTDLKEFSERFGWQEIEKDWQRVVKRDDIDLVIISAPNYLHMPISMLAAKHGKHILCEKPIALDSDQAQIMMNVANESGIIHMIGFNYRRIPAIVLANQLIDDGKLGVIRHFNAVYYQDWLVDPSFPFQWKLDIKKAGSGANGDLNAHLFDLARYLVGEIDNVCANQDIFVKQRPSFDGNDINQVSADDATTVIGQFRSGAMALFQASRFATGRKNFLRIEVFGSLGSLVFNLERINELEYFSESDPLTEQGFRRILVTEVDHPYIKSWWPPGHVIGWEHTFIHELADLLIAISKGQSASPNFYDGWMNQLILDAVQKSAKNNQWEKIPIID